MGSSSQADLHVHSKYSDRPGEWLLRRIGAPECFVEPLEVYRQAKARGMDFVTISDHNSIRGALEIAHLPGTFLSDEVTTYFPEDGCKIHCLAIGITPQQFEMIQELRANIYELRQFFLEEGILHSVSHPLFRVNERLTIDHVEKLLLLFGRFEAINGSRDPRATALIETVFGQLTPVMIEQMAARHGIEPAGAAPWKKSFTGGSDDHSGLHVGAAFTATPYADSVQAFLGHLRAGSHEPGGSAGGSLRLGRSLYHIAYAYYKQRFGNSSQDRPSLIEGLLERLLSLGREKRSRLSPFVPGFVSRLIQGHGMRRLSAIERSLAQEFIALLADGTALQCGLQNDEELFRTVARLGQTLGYGFLRKFADHLAAGKLIDSLQTLASLAPVAMGIAPYLGAFATQHKDEPFHRALAAHFPAARHLVQHSEAKCWISDTLIDVNGVSRTVRAMAREARRAGRRLVVLTCLERGTGANAGGGDPGDFRLAANAGESDWKNFAPLGTFRLPEYENQELAFPPFLEVVEYIERQRFNELVISTPGPMGLVALAAARLLNVPATGVYHTDFPLLVRNMTQDHSMEQVARRYMLWFYSQMDRVLVPSRYYLEELHRQGLDRSRLVLLGHGVDRRQFHPGQRDETFWLRRELNGDFTFIYVGRISREKNLEQLLEAFHRLVAAGRRANLAIVGDGPLLAELKTRFAHPRIAFTGFLSGEDLRRAYAGAQAMVFPSRTDTFGLAVLESHACGLPAIVSNVGGPPEIVETYQSGLVVEDGSADEILTAMLRMLDDAPARARMRRAALRKAAECSWSAVFEQFWQDGTPPAAAGELGEYRSLLPESLSALIAMDVA